jgi:hypothetical protein
MSFSQDESAPDDFFDVQVDRSYREPRDSFYSREMMMDESLLCSTCASKVKQVQNSLKEKHLHEMVR